MQHFIPPERPRTAPSAARRALTGPAPTGGRRGGGGGGGGEPGSSPLTALAGAAVERRAETAMRERVSGLTRRSA